MKQNDINKRLEESLSNVPIEERDALRDMWRLSENAEETPDINKEQVDALWHKLAHAATTSTAASGSMPLKQDRPAIRRSHKRRPISNLWVGAILGFILVATGIIVWLQPIVQTAPYGEQIVASLPDGSQIELNSGSSITYPRFFLGNRTVSLDGEAFFDITHSDIPFVVETFNAEIQVLGTTFNVKAWQNGWKPESKITLTSGSVRLSAKTAIDQSIVMEPGQTYSVHQSATEPEDITSDTFEHHLAWRKGELVFKDEKLLSVLEEIERRFGIDVNLRVNQLAEKEVTFAYRQASSAESILEDLCHALDLQYRPISNGYELFEE